MEKIISPFGTQKPPKTISCWLTEADRKYIEFKESKLERKINSFKNGKINSQDTQYELHKLEMYKDNYLKPYNKWKMPKSSEIRTSKNSKNYRMSIYNSRFDFRHTRYIPTVKHISNILYSKKYSDEWHLRHIIKFTIREISQQQRRRTELLNRKL